MMAKEHEDFGFETITQVYREENKSTTLSKLPANFYQNLNEYLEKLRDSYMEERENDPLSPKTMMLEDEYNKAQKRAFQIYEYRERKIVLLALQAANGGEPNLKSMTENERIAFDNLLDTLQKNRSFIMMKNAMNSCKSKSFLGSEEKISEVHVKEEKKEAEELRVEENIKVQKNSKPSIAGIEQKNPVLLILEDIPSFETNERTFNLKKDEAISLSKEYAKILCKHKKARMIKD
ncbi:MAG: hypothetical protein A7315_02370 [Candidatus Altiarchaeales archaeon WOR_SM1_79]|nr:MAG: hypothetical protein A7315_02370 [Candidatus Altiarchaeales archaeon WOR_SM1_79]